MNIITNLYNLLHQIANPILRTLQRLLKSATLGARAIVINQQNEILLVKHTYQNKWYLPGGGVEVGETVEEALIRELKEEVGITVQGPPQFFGLYYNNFQGVHDYPVIYVVKNFTVATVHSPEIQTSDWFAFAALPKDISPGSHRRIQEYLGHVEQTQRW